MQKASRKIAEIQVPSNVIHVQFGAGANPFALDHGFRAWCMQQNWRAAELGAPCTPYKELALQWRQKLNRRRVPKRLPKNVVSFMAYRARTSVGDDVATQLMRETVAWCVADRASRGLQRSEAERA